MKKVFQARSRGEIACLYALLSHSGLCSGPMKEATTVEIRTQTMPHTSSSLHGPVGFLLGGCGSDRHVLRGDAANEASRVRYRMRAFKVRPWMPCYVI